MYLLVAFLLGAVVVAGVVFAPGALTQGRITLATCSLTNCNVVSSVVNRLAQVERNLTADANPGLAGRFNTVEGKLDELLAR